MGIGSSLGVRSGITVSVVGIASTAFVGVEGVSSLPADFFEYSDAGSASVSLAGDSVETRSTEPSWLTEPRIVPGEEASARVFSGFFSETLGEIFSGALVAFATAATAGAGTFSGFWSAVFLDTAGSDFAGGAARPGEISDEARPFPSFARPGRVRDFPDAGGFSWAFAGFPFG
jgi:hypothetical protein